MKATIWRCTKALRRIWRRSEVNNCAPGEMAKIHVAVETPLYASRHGRLRGAACVMAKGAAAGGRSVRGGSFGGRAVSVPAPAHCTYAHLRVLHLYAHCCRATPLPVSKRRSQRQKRRRDINLGTDREDGIGSTSAHRREHDAGRGHRTNVRG